MKHALTLTATVLLAACATAPSPYQIGPAPAGYKEQVRAYVKRSFFDPYSIRDAEISQPLPASMVFDGLTPIPHSGWMVCLYANSKNRFGAYAGRQLTGILFENGDIGAVLSTGTELQAMQHCRYAKYTPFAV